MPKTRTPKGRKRLVLLDAHALLHRAYHALPEFTSSRGVPTGGLYGYLSMILRIVADFRPDYLVACYDLPQKTFRHEAYEAYKGTRAKSDEALVEQIKSSRYVCEKISVPIYDAPGFEADDMLGTIVEQTRKRWDADGNLEVIIATGDMDSLQLVHDGNVRVFTLKKGMSDTVIYDEKAVRERFGFGPELLPDWKGLRGDPSDNIVGVPGIGEKTATDLILAFGTVENLYEELHRDRDAFLRAGIRERIVKLLEEHEESALFSKTLATIRNDAPITFTIPEKPWLETCSLEVLEPVLREFEFKSLITRFREVLGKGTASASETAPAKASPEAASRTKGKSPSRGNVSDATDVPDASGGHDQSALSESAEPFPLLRDAQIALWLLNSDLTSPEEDDILSYARTETLEQALPVLEDELRKNGLDFVYRSVELPLVPILDRMRSRGVLIDTEFLGQLSGELHAELSSYEQKIHAHVGHAFNVNSPKQLGEVLFGEMRIHAGIKGFRVKKTASGTYSTRESDLEKLADAHPIITDIFEYRELQKMLSTYIDNLPSMADGDGRLHPELLQTGTTTGRFSSQNPNIQNIPIRSAIGRRIRGAFIAPPGYSLVSADYSQIELRSAAMLSGDPVFMETFIRGGDVHASVAARVFHVDEKDVTSDMRRKAKVINFGILFGMGVTALQKNLGTTRVEAQTFYDEYFRQLPGLAEYLRDTVETARKTGHTETLFGRRRSFPGLVSRIPFIRAMAERAASNAPIQGTTADIIKLAMIDASGEIRSRGWQDRVFMVMQIHDELVFEVPDEILADFHDVIRATMEGVLDRVAVPIAHKIPIDVSVSSGKTWGEAKD